MATKTCTYYHVPRTTSTDLFDGPQYSTHFLGESCLLAIAKVYVIWAPVSLFPVPKSTQINSKYSYCAANLHQTLGYVPGGPCINWKEVVKAKFETLSCTRFRNMLGVVHICLACRCSLNTFLVASLLSLGTAHAVKLLLAWNIYILLWSPPLFDYLEFLLHFQGQYASLIY